MKLPLSLTRTTGIKLNLKKIHRFLILILIFHKHLHEEKVLDKKHSTAKFQNSARFQPVDLNRVS